MCIPHYSILVKMLPDHNEPSFQKGEKGSGQATRYYNVIQIHTKAKITHFKFPLDNSLMAHLNILCQCSEYLLGNHEGLEQTVSAE